MADDFPDLHHKLCKKAAHLTTGNFYLQLKNDENDLILKTHMDAYEQEMDNIVQTANDILDKHMKENSQYKEVKEIHTAYQQFKQEIEEERSLAAIQFNNYKNALEEKYEQREKDIEDLIKSYEQEVDDVTEKLKFMQELVQKSIGDDVEQNYQKEMEQRRLLESKDLEIEDLHKRYLELERMYRELEESRFLSGKRISGQWSRGGIDGEGENENPGENEILKKKIVEQEKLIFALRNLVHENIIEDAEYAPSIEFGASNTDEMSALSVQLSTLQKEAKNAKAASLKALKDRDEEIEKLRDKIKEGGSDDKVQKIVEEYENRMKEASREHRKMIESLNAEYNDNIAEMEADFEKERIRWESKEQGMHNTLESRSEYIAGLEEKLRHVEEMSTKYKTKSELEIKDKEETLSQEIQRLNNVLEDSRKIFDEKLEANLKKAEEARLKLLEETKADKEKSLQALREELNNERRASEIQKDAKVKELEAQLKNFQEAPKNTELAEEYQNKINDLSQRHNNYVRDLLEKHEEKVQNMTKQYAQELENLSSALQREKENVLKMKDEAKNSEIVNLKKDYEAKMHKISKSYDQQLQEKIHEFEAKLTAKDTEITTLKAELDALRDQLRAEKKKFEMKNSLYKDLKKKLEAQKSPSRSMQIAPQEKSTLSESVYSFRDSIAKVKEISSVHKGLKKDHEEKIKVLTNQLNEVVAAFNARPSKEEDVTYIRQLQEENFEKEEEIRKLMDGGKVYLPEMPPRRENMSFTKGFNSSTHLNTSSLQTQGDFKRKTQKSLINPQSTASLLPPISISQFTIQFRSPQMNSSMASTKKFFK